MKQLSDFDQWIDQQVADAVGSGSRTFKTLVSGIGSVYPTLILQSLARLNQSGDVDAFVYEAIVRSAHSRCDDPEGLLGGSSMILPVPHPLDYDWRFTPESADALLRRAMDAAGGRRVLLLGAPTVFTRAIRTGIGQHFTLVDSNPTLRGAFQTLGYGDQVVTSDLAVDTIPDLCGAAAVADPPWYPETIKSFLWVGQRMLAPGSAILISLPPEGTRPGIVEEREDLLSWTTRAGLRLVTIERRGTRYLTPPFERNALSAAGVRAPLSWRTGDLASFQVLTASHEPRPPVQTRSGRWEEVVVGHVRIRVLTSTETDSSGDARLVHLVPGDVLQSVSSRDPIRDSVRVWTSGNRVYGCEAPHLLLHRLRTLAGACCGDIARTPVGDNPEIGGSVAQQLSELIRLEQSEYGA